MTDTSAALAAIERTLQLKAPPERVWRAISEPDELARWFAQRAEWELRPGGSGTFFWEGYGDFEIRVEAVEPGRYLAWRWGEGTVASIDDTTPTTLVEWWIEPRPDGGTTLRLRESGFTRPERRAGNEEGWSEELGELVAFLGEPDAVTTP